MTVGEFFLFQALSLPSLFSTALYVMTCSD